MGKERENRCLQARVKRAFAGRAAWKAHEWGVVAEHALQPASIEGCGRGRPETPKECGLPGGRTRIGTLAPGPETRAFD